MEFFDNLSKSGSVLIAGNLLTIIVALVFSTSVLTVMWAYWFESVFIGMFTAVGFFLPGIRTKNPVLIGVAVFFAGFFFVHYGFFHVVYALFLGMFSTFFADPSNVVVTQVGAGSYHITSTSPPVFPSISPEGVFFVITLFIVHFYSFIENQFSATPKEKTPQAMVQSLTNGFAKPYARIFPMHVSIILAGFAFVFFPHEFDLVLLLIFMGLKTVVDLGAHNTKNISIVAKHD